MSVPVSAIVNGRSVTTEVEPNDLLLDFLRDRLGLTGAKQSCQVEVCGACTVLVDARPVSACMYLACDVDGRTVETVEGIVGSDFHRAAVEAFMRHAAVQCGFCTSGMLLTAKFLQNEGVAGSDPAIRREMRGNLCRCTGYRAIIDALVEVLGAERPGAERLGAQREAIG